MLSDYFPLVDGIYNLDIPTLIISVICTYFTCMCIVYEPLYSALQDSCPLERVNRQWLNSVMVHNTKAISLYSDIDSCSFTTPARQLTCKAL